MRVDEGDQSGVKISDKKNVRGFTLMIAYFELC